jgi:hypothetical protein
MRGKILIKRKFTISQKRKITQSATPYSWASWNKRHAAFRFKMLLAQVGHESFEKFTVVLLLILLCSLVANVFANKCWNKSYPRDR